MTTTTKNVHCDEPERALRSAGVFALGNHHACAFAPFLNAVVGQSSHEPMPAELLEVVLLERAPLAEEHAVGGRLGARPVLERRQLKGADVVRELEEAVVGRGHELVDHNILPERVLDCLVNGLGNDRLPVVVVDLHPVESLEIGEVVERGNDEVPLYGDEELVGAVRVKLLFVRERDVAERNPFGEHGKTAEMALSRADRETLVFFVAREQGPEVHWHVDKLLVSNELIVSGEDIAQVVALLVKYESDQVVLGVAGVPRLVHKDGQFFHGCDLLANKNAGGHPPALGGQPLREDHLFYTTGIVLSSRRYYGKHMFVTQRKTAGKWREIIDSVNERGYVPCSCEKNRDLSLGSMGLVFALISNEQALVYRLGFVHEHEYENYALLLLDSVDELVLIDFDSENGFSDKLANFMVDYPESLLCLELLQDGEDSLVEIFGIRFIAADIANVIDRLFNPALGRAKQPDVKSHERLESLRALLWRRRRCRGATHCRHRGLPSFAPRSASLSSLGLRLRVPWLLLPDGLDDCTCISKIPKRLLRGAQKRTRLVRLTPCINYRKAA